MADLKTLAKTFYRNFVEDPLNTSVTPTLNHKFKIKHYKLPWDMAGLMSDRAPNARGKVHLTLPLPVLKKTIQINYFYPATFGSLTQKINDALYEANEHRGQSLNDLMGGLFDRESGKEKSWTELAKEVEKVFNNPAPITKTQVIIEQRIRQVADAIERDYDLTRYQTYFVFSRVFRATGYVPKPYSSSPNTDPVEGALERVADFMEEHGDRVRSLDPNDLDREAIALARLSSLSEDDGDN